MKKLERNVITQKIIAIVLVLATLLTSFPMSIFAATDVIDNGNGVSVKFGAKWSSDEIQETGTTADTFDAEYSFTLNGAPTGFQNVQLLLETDAVQGANDKITVKGITGGTAQTSTGTGYAAVNFGNLNQGQEIGGQISVKFYNDNVETRKLTLTLTGTYTDPQLGITKNLNIKKELEAVITPATVVTPYLADMTWQEGGQNNYSSPTIEANRTNIYDEYNNKIGFYTNSLQAFYPIKLYSKDKTQELKLEIKINRYSADGTQRLSSSDTINWDGLDTDLGQPTVTDNADGSRTYTFTKGSDSNGYDASTAFSVDKTYNIVVTYITPDTDPREGDAEFRTFVEFEAELNTVGYKLEKVYRQPETSERITENKKLTDLKGINLYSYTPGKNAWISVNADSSYINGYSKITNDIRTRLKNGETLSVDATVGVKFVNGTKNANQTGYINIAKPRLVYVDDNGTTKSIYLDESQMKIKKIEKSDLNMYDSEYVESSIATPFSDSYTVNNDANIFSIKLNDFVSEAKTSADYDLTYELNLSEAGLTATEIENIQSLQINFSTSGSQYISGQDSFILSREVVKAQNRYSYMEMQFVDIFNTTSDALNKTETKTLKLRMYRNNNVIKDTSTSRNNVLNESPVFYVEFPESGTKFEYDIDLDDIRITPSSNIKIDEENIDLITIDNSDYLVIPCIGKYADYLDAEVDINVTFTRKLLDDTNSKTYINTYMLTNNENYFYESRNYNEFLKPNGDESDVAFLAKGSFNVVGMNKLEAVTRVYHDRNIYQPNPSDGINNDLTEKEKPLIINSNNTITYESKISAQNQEIKDVVILSRLPIANNTFIETNTNNLIENGFALPDEYYEVYGNSLNGNASGSPVTQLSMTNLNLVGIYRINADKTEELLDSSKYKIYYTTTANATFDTAILQPGETFDSTKFVEYVPGGTNTDFANATNIKVVITDSTETLTSGQSYAFRYEMTMPNQAGMVGAETAVKYTKVGETTSNNLFSPAAYVINGNENATINVQKIFENYPAGIVPTEYGVNSLAGIEFKLQYYDQNTGRREFVKDSSNNDLVAVTDSTGKATFNNIPEGRYFLYEVTTFAQYSGIGNVNIINAGIGETINYVPENRLKRGNLEITKTWQNATETQGHVQFQVSRINANNETFEFEPVIVETDDNDKAFLTYLPYGTYSITEYSGQVGWTPEVVNKTVTVSADDVTTTFNNVPATATLQIVKTVPGRESVDGLSFKVTGRGAIVKQDTLNFDVNTVTEFTIGGQNNPGNVTITTSENDTVATIEISGLYLGYYTIEETNIPEIVDGVATYAALGDSTILGSNGETVTVNLQNNHQYGKIIIEKDAKLKDGDTLYPISDLSGFQIQITGHSFYDANTEINETLVTDDDGHAEIELEVGEYTITELAAEGYDTYYGENSSASQQAPTVRLTQNNQVITQKIYNEHTGVGYVKVVKSLEGVTDPEEVVGKNIKFAVVGRNVAQQKIGNIIEGTLQGVLIEINQIDTVNNVAYGISGPISINGDYELQEVPSSIPDFYEAYEPTAIQVTSAHTQANPNVIDVTNYKSRGNLEIITTTNPEGGPLTGIQYNVTPVKINSDATYTATGATQTVDGSNDSANASFAKLENIYAGFYAVEQVPESIADGWRPDVKQIVEVPGNNTGYANFEITQKKQVKTNKVTIRKELLNSNNETATSEDIENAELNEDEKFEVKITNVATGDEYYVFTSAAEPGVITGLDVGTYRIEEVYKPKYLTLGFYKEENEIDANNQPRVATYSIADVNNRFTISEEFGTINDVTLIVKNQINTDFGFGGQDSRENLSRLVVEDEEITLTTKAVIYVTDEQDKAIAGVKFSLYNSDNELITLNKLGSEFEINDYKLVIKGLPAGKYTLKCTEYPEGYLKPDDKEVIVYSDATQVVRVEVQKNIPRGSLTISTIYTKSNGDPRYLSSSEYKVVDSATGELVKFVRTPSGNYKKSNAADASPIITLKAAPVEVQGLELGDYEVGIVGIKKGYGIIKEGPEYVTVEANTNKDVVTNVINKSIVHVGAFGATSMYVDSNGDLYYIGYINNSVGYDTNVFKKIYFGDDVKITQFSYLIANNLLRVIAIDDEGGVWTYGAGPSELFGVTTGGKTNNTAYLDGTAIPPVCITKNGDLRDAYNAGARFVDVQLVGTYEMLILDNQGRVWSMGMSACDGNGNNYVTYTSRLVQPFIDNNVKIAKLARCGSINNTNSAVGAVDTEGKVWIWGGYTYPIDPSGEYNVYTPKCLSNSTSLGDVKIVDLIIKDENAMALDENGEIWVWGSNSALLSTLQGGSASKTPTKVSKSTFGGKKIVSINMERSYSSDYMAAVIDEEGKVWTWGNQHQGELGQDNTNSSVTIPTCISDDTTEVLYGKQIKELDIAGQNYQYPYGSNGYVCHVVALDTDNNMWAWGGNSLCGEAGTSIPSDLGGVKKPQRLYSIYNEHLEYNLKFEKIYGVHGSNYAIDSEGKVWGWGSNGNCVLGIQPSNSVAVPTQIEIPGDSKVVKAVNYSNSGLILTEDGRVFATGYKVFYGNGQTNSGSIPLTEITDYCPPSIKDVMFMGYVYVMLDEYGQVWTWGDSDGSLGRPSTNKYTKEIILSGIEKISGGYSGGLGLSADGKVYAWKTTNSPVLCPSDKTFVDICGLFAKDSDGCVWYWNGTKFVLVYGPSISLYDSYCESNPDYMIVDMYNPDAYGEQILLKDSNGEILSMSGTNPVSRYNLGRTDIKMINGSYYVDYSGQIWTLSQNSANIMTDTKVANTMYGLRFKHLYTDRYATKTNGDMYDINNKAETTATATIYTNDVVDYLSEVKGKQVIQQFGDCYLDSEKHIWWKKSSSDYPICLHDEGNALEGVTIDTLYTYIPSSSSYGDYTYYAKDTDGNYWAWGYNNKGQLGNNTTSTDRYNNPVKLTRFENVTLTKFKTTGYQCMATDSNNDFWVWGSNSNGTLGTGNTSDVLQPTKITSLSGKQVADFDFGKTSSSNGIILCTDGSVYLSNTTSSTRAWLKIGDTAVDGVGGATSKSCELNGNYILSGSNKIWAISGVNIVTLATDKEVKLGVYLSGSNEYGIVDTTGKYWVYDKYENTLTLDETKGTIIDTVGIGYYINSEGHVFGSSAGEKDVSSVIIDMFGSLTEANIQKYADLVKSNNTFTLIDGKLWKFKVSSGAIISYTCYYDWTIGDIGGKTITEYTSSYALDNNGRLYRLSDGKDLTKDEYNVTESVFNVNNNIINAVRKNPVYGTKFKDVSNDVFATDYNDHVWYFPVSGEAVDISTVNRGVNNPAFGKQIKKMINANYFVTTDNKVWRVTNYAPKYVMDTVDESQYTILSSEFGSEGSEYIVALDGNGKIWVSGTNIKTGVASGTTNGEVVCLNDIQDSAFYNVVVAKAVYDSSTAGEFIIIDTNGKVWTWGVNQYPTPTCLTDIADSELNTAFNNGITIVDYYDTFNFDGGSPRIMLKDSNGEDWFYSNSSNILTKWGTRDTYIGKSNDDIVKDMKVSARLMTNGKLFFRYPKGTNTYSSYGARYTNINEIVSNANVPFVDEVFDGYCYERNSSSLESTMIALANTANGVYAIKATYTSANRYNNYAATVTNPSTACIEKMVSTGYYANTQVILLDENGDLWLSGCKGRIFNNTNTNDTSIATYDCITTNSNSPLYNIKFSNIEKIENTIIGTSIDNKVYYITKNYGTISPKELDNDAAAITLYGTADNAHKKQLYAEPEIVYYNNKYYTVTNGETVEEVERDYLDRYCKGVGIIDEVIGEYDFKNIDGVMYRIVPTGVSTYDIVKITEPTEFTTATPDEAVNIPNVTVYKQVKHKALDTNGNLYVWDTNTGILKETEGVVCITDVQNSVDPIYNTNDNGWSVIVTTK